VNRNAGVFLCDAGAILHGVFACVCGGIEFSKGTRFVVNDMPADAAIEQREMRRGEF
jgi:hypothetical protein